jgi:hypothetical protein
MKIRLSQSNCGSTADQVFLQALHFRGAGGGLIVIAAQVKEAMRDVETQLVFKRCAKRSRLSLRHFRADHDLAMLERDDVGWPSFIKEPLMKLRNPSVGHQSDNHFVELRQCFSFPSRKFEARGQSVFGKMLQRPRIDPNHPLAVAHNDSNRSRSLCVSLHVSGRDSAWKFRVINRAPLLNVK